MLLHEHDLMCKIKGLQLYLNVSNLLLVLFVVEFVLQVNARTLLLKPTD